MKSFRIIYRWSEREYATVMPGPTAVHAMWMAQLQIMQGARIIGIEVSK